MDRYKAYEMFTELIDRGKGDVAYDIFRKNPRLVTYMRFAEIPGAYTEIKSRVGEKEAYYFGFAVVKEITDILDNYLPIIDVIMKGAEQISLEKFLRQIDDKYKRMLKEMGESEG